MTEFVTKKNGIVDVYDHVLPVPVEEFLTIDEIVEDILQNRLDDATMHQIRAFDRNELTMLHFSFGMWIRNTYGLWLENNPLTELDEQSDQHPDAISFDIIKLVWKRLQSPRDA